MLHHHIERADGKDHGSWSVNTGGRGRPDGEWETRILVQLTSKEGSQTRISLDAREGLSLVTALTDAIHAARWERITEEGSPCGSWTVQTGGMSPYGHMDEVLLTLRDPDRCNGDAETDLSLPLQDMFDMLLSLLASLRTLWRSQGDDAGLERIDAKERELREAGNALLGTQGQRP